MKILLFTIISIGLFYGAFYGLTWSLWIQDYFPFRSWYGPPTGMLIAIASIFGALLIGCIFYQLIFGN